MNKFFAKFGIFELNFSISDSNKTKFHEVGSTEKYHNGNSGCQWGRVPAGWLAPSESVLNLSTRRQRRRRRHQTFIAFLAQFRMPKRLGFAYILPKLKELKHLRDARATDDLYLEVFRAFGVRTRRGLISVSSSPKIVHSACGSGSRMSSAPRQACMLHCFRLYETKSRWVFHISSIRNSKN